MSRSDALNHRKEKLFLLQVAVAFPHARGSRSRSHPPLSASPVLNQDTSRVACSAHTKASGDHRASTRCVSRILACALRRDTMAAALHVPPSPLYAVDGGANGERLAFLPVGRFLRLLLFLSLPLPVSLVLFLEEGARSSRRTPVVISRKIPFSRPRPKKFHRARRLLANGGGNRECGMLVGSRGAKEGQGPRE